MYDKLRKLFDGAMKGRTMYVIPYCMGPIGSPFSKVGVELTDSIYVVLNMDIMTRMGQQAFDQLGETSNDFVRGLHSKAQMDEENRYIVQFPRGQHHLVRQLRLRRQRAARQEVLRAAHRLVSGEK